ncbi:MAG: uracil-DNA glycosylase [Phycisphaeraceae bacterium]|nr:uracil-DNA glycosylase [Phycisphaeraceae bacterium]
MVSSPPVPSPRPLPRSSSSELSAAAKRPSGPAPSGPLSRQQKLDILAAMNADEVVSCTKCDLCRTRIQTVFGEGDPDTPLLFVGEGPGQTEDEQGRPFVGRAGELLNKMIVAMGLGREQVYIANVVKCRPPNNRPPTPVEVDACSGYLLRQIATLRPKVIVTLGGPATKLLLSTSQGITTIRGTWHQFNGLQPEGPIIPVMPTFHPAYLLRAYTEDNRRKVWSDLQKVMQKIKGESETK